MTIEEQAQILSEAVAETRAARHHYQGDIKEEERRMRTEDEGKSSGSHQRSGSASPEECWRYGILHDGKAVLRGGVRLRRDSRNGQGGRPGGMR